MLGFSKPAIGTEVVVTTDWSDYLGNHPSYVARHSTVRGQVVQSDPEVDSPTSFRVLTDNPHFPYSVVELARVVRLSVAGEAQTAPAPAVAPKTPAVKVVKPVNYEVPNSRGTGSYVVTQRATMFTCNCKGFEFRQNCKHVQEVKAALVAQGKL